ncbi:MAG: hypothetical protein JWN36_289 [Microbacteriaceae bacterium]|nr:hypothetical protein [Microbacteriaceae bacterium]
MRLDAGLVATAGTWEWIADGVRFTPRFAAVPGTTYVVLGRADDRWRELASVTVPPADRSRTVLVESIDPGVDEVPANLLRFAVTFSAPMENGSAEGRIHLLDASGAELPGTLLDMPPELWDGDHRRLTVLLEPGRIKRGLQPNVQAGPPLREGDTVTLVVDSGLRDASGAELADGAHRSYRVGAPIRSRVDPGRWDVRWPAAPTDPLVVRFDRPLDRALALRCLRALDADGHPLAGRTELDAEARAWAFTPAGGVAGSLRIDTRLEDLAGNSVRRVFDRDLADAADDGIDATEVILTPS